MCMDCDAGAAIPRRKFLTLAAAAAASAAMPLAAKAKGPAPKPENILTPDAALARLMEGNARYVAGIAKRHDFKHEREPLTRGQNPYAGILSCADSRIAPEYCFDSGRGDLFVCRVAGNFANADGIASFEYAVQVLGAPLILVLGHKACGAVDATIKSLKDGTTLPGHLPSLVTALAPAVKDAQGDAGDLLDNAIRRNVVRNVEALKTATPILSKFVEDKKLRVAGGIYELSTGKVTLV